MTSVHWMMLLINGCNRRAVIVAVCLLASLGCVQVAANDQQVGDDETLVRGRREAVSFWKRLQQQHPSGRDKIASFWKRAHPHDSLASFWKRGLPAGAGLQAFWKRFVVAANDADDAPASFARLAGSEKKNNVHVSHPQQQRRANEVLGRRPEFNPTGW